MKTFSKDLKERLKNKSFKKAYDKERAHFNEQMRLVEFGLFIKKARTEYKLSQQQLASKAKVTQQQLSSIEAGANATIQTYIRVCVALDVPLTLGKGREKVAA